MRSAQPLISGNGAGAVAVRPGGLGAIALALLVLSATPAGAATEDLGRIRFGFIDITFDQNQEDYRDPAAAEYGDSLYVAWVSKEANPGSPGGGATDTLLSRVLYVRPFSDVSGRPSWGNVVLLTPNSTDTLGHGNHAPVLAAFSGRLYVLWQSNDPSQKPVGGGQTTVPRPPHTPPPLQ